ncbi:MAG: hypothetical protein ACJ76H_14925 [Bacteriovoracaceae bacterium]
MIRTFLTGLFLLVSVTAFAEVGDFLPTQKTISKPFSLPIKIDLDGKINFITGDRNLVFAPGVQVGFDRSVVQYSLPIYASEFSLMPPSENGGWMEYKRKRYDYGTGIQAIVQKSFRFGLAPYRGARFSMKRLKMNKDTPTSDKVTMPDSLDEIRPWSTGDEGSYQTYGGIQVYAGVSIGPVGIAGGALAWQNQFIVSIERKDDGIRLSVAEEKLNRQSLDLGFEPLNGTWTHFKGKQLKAEFELDFANPAHHELYKQALKGKLTKLQDGLPSEKKTIKWEGNDVSVYWGIPWVYGTTDSRGSYHVEEDQQDYFLEVIQRKNSGLLVSTMWQQMFVYHNADSMLLMWTTDMKKADAKKLEKHFFGPAKAVGFPGFDIELDKKNYGTVIGEAGVVVTKEDVERFESIDSATIEDGLKIRCEELKFDCAKPKKLREIMKRYTEAMKENWDQRKKLLGILLVRRPALLHTLLRQSRITKDAYFKFLSDRYQSLEGLSVLR